RCGYSASGQVFLHADEDRRCEAWRTRRFASMGPPSIDYSITLFGGEGNETHGSISWLFEHPNVLMGHPQPGVRPVSHAGTLDLHPLNELQSLSLQLLSVPLGHPHDLAAANVVLAVNDHDAAGPKYPNTFSPVPPVRFSVRLAPLLLARIGRMERSSEGVAVRVSPRPVAGVVVVGHAVPVCGTRHDGIKFSVTCPRHSRRVSDVHLDMCRRSCGPLGFGPLGDDATREAVVAQQANLSDTRHRIKDTLRPVFPKNTGEDRQEHVSILGGMSRHVLDRHHRHLTYKIPPRMGTLMMRPLRVGRSYKGSANCTLDSLRFAISTYSGLISIPTACRPRRSATSKVVPLPAKGSRTRHLPLPSLPSQVQVGSQRSPVRSRSTTRFHGA